jgi:hypothetical protein
MKRRCGLTRYELSALAKNCAPLHTRKNGWIARVTFVHAARGQVYREKGVWRGEGGWRTKAIGEGPLFYLVCIGAHEWLAEGKESNANVAHKPVRRDLNLRALRRQYDVRV